MSFEEKKKGRRVQGYRRRMLLVHFLQRMFVLCVPLTGFHVCVKERVEMAKRVLVLRL